MFPLNYLSMKSLIQLTSGIKVLSWTGDPEVMLTGLTIDSRNVSQGMLFAALRGTRSDGHSYIEQAIINGASAILCEDLPANPDPGLTWCKVPDAAEALGYMASAWYDHPSEKIRVVGVTGTNGKTTIATLLYELFEALGYPSGLISTIRNRIHRHELQATHTTPDALSIQALLARMADEGCEFAFMEVSSHALDQRRVSGLRFAGAIFTNLTRDHLDYHKDVAAYLKAKKRLFDELPEDAFALTNLDDRNGRVMLQNCRARQFTYATQSAAGYHLRVTEQRSDGMLLDMAGAEVWIRLVGAFNAQNICAIWAAAELLGQQRGDVLTALSKLPPVEGRIEAIPLGRGITGIVDYAHTPDALENVLETLNELVAGGGRIITVFGAGGDRDRGKRPAMAEVACRLSNMVIISSDNPRSELPESIIDDIAMGVPPDKIRMVMKITDRREAIKTAVNLAQPGDIILVAGKGHETYQEIRGVRHHFDDREELKALIERKPETED